MATVRVKATKTDRYAQSEPCLPQIFMMEGQIYTLPREFAMWVISLNGAEMVEDTEEDDFTEEADENLSDVETSSINIESKESTTGEKTPSHVVATKRPARRKNK